MIYGSVKYVFMFLFGVMLLRAETERSGGGAKPARLAILALGAKPTRSYVRSVESGKDSASVMLAPKVGVIPPRVLYINAGDDEGDASRIHLAFNNPPQYVDVRSGRELVLWRRGVLAHSEKVEYLRIAPLKPGSFHLLILRAGGRGDERWLEEPRKSMLDLGGGDLLKKKFGVWNLSKRSIKSIYHEDSVMMKPGSFMSYDALAGVHLHRVSAAYAKSKKRIYTTAYKFHRRRDLLLHLLYDANPHTNDRRTVGLFTMSVRPRIGKDVSGGE